VSTKIVWRLPVYLAIGLLGGGFAYWADPYLIQIALGVVVAALLALSWDVLSRCGQVSLGHAGFFGIGAYFSAMFAEFHPAIPWIAGIGACAIAAALLGMLTLRLQRVYFTIATLGFALALQVPVLIFDGWTGGAGGIAPALVAGGDPAAQLLVGTALLVIAAVISDVVLSAWFRPAFFMIRTKPELAASSGVPVVRTKLLAFVMSGALGGAAGVLYAGLYGYIVPGDVFNLNWSVLPLAVTILGGMDTTLGPLLGTIVLRLLEEVARAYIGGVGYQVVYGGVIIFFIAVMPTGLYGFLRGIVMRLRSDATKADKP
jgi:branched-chain amino acid transport system permease protein